MATEHENHDERIAEAIRSLADDDGRLTSPPPNLWGRIERAIDDPQEGDDDLVPPPPELWDRIAEEVRAEGSAPAAERRSSWGRYRTIILAAAAVLVVCAIASAVVLVGRDRGGSTELVARAALTGEGLDPGGDGSGEAELLRNRGGWKVAIQVDHLPKAPPGSYYEAWLLGSGAGQVQSLGSLQGADRFAVPDGISIKDFPVVDVSIEPIDGNPAHSAKSVLRGRLETA